MSDVAAAAASPAASPAAPAPLMPAPETIRSAAADKLSVLKRDPAFAQAYLQGGTEQRNTFQTLLRLAHGENTDAEVTALAASIKLEPLHTLRAAERQRADAGAAADVNKPDIPYAVASKLSPEELGTLRTDISTWVADLKLSPTSTRTVLDRIASEGPKVSAMSGEERAAWLGRQEELLTGAAGNKERAAAWRADAEKMLAKTKYNLASSPVLNDIFVIRHLALAASVRK